MSITPPRAFALGVVSVLLLAGAFVAGIGVADTDPVPAIPESQIHVAQEVIACPPAPGFEATRAAHERYGNCVMAQRIQLALLESGVRAADVQVSRRPNLQLVGPEGTIAVVARVVEPDQSWDVAAAAAAISAISGSRLEDVTIVDERLRTLFEPPSAPGAPAVDPEFVRPAAKKSRPSM